MSKLYFYYSVMNSGKSAHIIMQVHNLREQKNNVLVMKPKLDTRDVGVIKSRALQTELHTILIDEETNIFDIMYDYMEKIEINYLFVDEVSFLNKEHIEQLADVADVLQVPVFCYGLLTDYKSHLFEGSKRLIELSDSIRELKSPCIKCGRKATMHLRKIDDAYVFEGDSIHVGDTDTYESVCRSCYQEERMFNQE